MPSRPILQACANTVGPSPSICMSDDIVAAHLAAALIQAGSQYRPVVRNSTPKLSPPLFRLPGGCPRRKPKAVSAPQRGNWQVLMGRTEITQQRDVTGRADA